jgi:hypothetical protein
MYFSQNEDIKSAKFLFTSVTEVNDIQTASD